ncbi:MAG TPA: Do family serine endopeptidase [Candidatus Saccharimonadales bacterium]|nr:Do family serine endopeptidase [Candidatus Saccharimonadales bacterium]
MKCPSQAPARSSGFLPKPASSFPQAKGWRVRYLYPMVAKRVTSWVVPRCWPGLGNLTDEREFLMTRYSLYIALLFTGLLGPAGQVAQCADVPKVLLQTEPLPREGRVFPGFADVVKKVAPSVVTVYSTKLVKEDSRNPMMNDPLLRKFFGLDDEPDADEAPPSRRRGRQRDRQEEGLGSGVIISPDGYILSNSHVVEGADEVKVSFVSGGADLVAKVVGIDKATDVSVLKVDMTNLTPIVMTDSTNLHVGDIVLAVGNPFGVGQTVTMGIASAVGRGGFGITDYEDFVQTDASINPGNSGGALVDAGGRLVGINTAIISRTGGSLGIGFAVPVNLARGVMERIIKEGKVVRGYLGVYIQPLTSELASAFHLPDNHGALVGGVSAKSPAAAAGLREGDVIVEMNGQQVEDSRNLRLKISQTSPGTKINMKVLRDGKPQNVIATLGALPEQEVASAKSRETPQKPKTEGLVGIEVTDLTARARRQLDLPSDLKGALVVNVDQDSVAFENGIRPGDVILDVNRQKVKDAKDCIDQIKKAKDRVLFRVWSKGGTHFLTLDLKNEK